MTATIEDTQEATPGRPKIKRSFSVHPEEKESSTSSSAGQTPKVKAPLAPAVPKVPAAAAGDSVPETSEEPTQSAHFDSINLPTRSTSHPSELSRVGT